MRSLAALLGMFIAGVVFVFTFTFTNKEHKCYTFARKLSSCVENETTSKTLDWAQNFCMDYLKKEETSVDFEEFIDKFNKLPNSRACELIRTFK